LNEGNNFKPESVTFLHNFLLSGEAGKGAETSDWDNPSHFNQEEDPEKNTANLPGRG